jgi:hypothetical protein
MQDIERYKAAFAQPYSLTAAVNYYRASIDNQTRHPVPEIEK